MTLASLAALTLTLAGQEESTLEKLEKDIAAVVERIRPSVVRVHADELTFSGVVYTPEGHIITDASGLDQAVEIRVTVGEKSYPAERVAADRRTGVAVLKIPARDLKPAPICPDPCKPGTTARSRSAFAPIAVGCCWWPGASFGMRRTPTTRCRKLFSPSSRELASSRGRRGWAPGCTASSSTRP